MDLVYNYIIAINNSICDDCLAHDLNFNNRQLARYYSKKLANFNLINREVNLCNHCNGNKFISQHL